MSIFEEIELINRSARSGLKAVSKGSLVLYYFSHGTQTGTTGPNQTVLDIAYSGTNLEGNVTSVGNGYQEWDTPNAGMYTINCIGAAGGFGIPGGNQLGHGASITADLYLSANTTLKICVGQVGADINGSVWIGGGGGGMSLVTIDNPPGNPLVVAGGGGGSSSIALGSNRHASLGNSGYSGANSGGAGGTGGGGGNAAQYTGGGGGFVEDGGDSTSGNYGRGGHSFPDLLGGASGFGDGGFGGGGDGGNAGGGGGGGYSGGGGGNYGSSLGGDGGGGGSYTNPLCSNVVSVQAVGSGYGSVTITSTSILLPGLLIPVRKSIRL